MQLKKIIQKLEKNYPTKLAFENDPIGISVGSPAKEVKKVLVSLDCSKTAIDMAVVNDCDVIITHHPLIYGDINELMQDNFFKERFDKVTRNKIAVYSMHTNFDCAKHGMNYMIAKLFNPTKIGPFAKSGLGKVAYFSDPVSITDILNTCKGEFGVNTLYGIWPRGREKISSMAVVGGSCDISSIKEALNMEVDVLLTGELAYHNQFVAKEQGQNIILATHFMENIFTRIISDELEELGVEVVTNNPDNPLEVLDFNNQ